MAHKRNGSDASGDAAPSQVQSYPACNSTKPPHKWKRVLLALLNGKTLNRFEAEREVHDHCLHSTVSTIEKKGVTILRAWESVPGFKGILTEVRRYWIAPESRQKAAELLGLTAVSRIAPVSPYAPLLASAREVLTLTP